MFIYICFINGIFQLKLKGFIQLYADHIAIVYGEASVPDLKDAMKTDLIIVESFLNSHFLAINSKKTKVIVFPGRNKTSLLKKKS